jgi:hypothetical protein
MKIWHGLAVRGNCAYGAFGRGSLLLVAHPWFVGEPGLNPHLLEMWGTQAGGWAYSYQMLLSDQACCPVTRQLPPRVMATAGSIGVRW